jgi:hypothetical protein
MIFRHRVSIDGERESIGPVGGEADFSHGMRNVAADVHPGVAVGREVHGKPQAVQVYKVYFPVKPPATEGSRIIWSEPGTGRRHVILVKGVTNMAGRNMVWRADGICAVSHG